MGKKGPAKALFIELPVSLDLPSLSIHIIIIIIICKQQTDTLASIDFFLPLHLQYENIYGASEWRHRTSSKLSCIVDSTRYLWVCTKLILKSTVTNCNVRSYFQ